MRDQIVVPSTGTARCRSSWRYSPCFRECVTWMFASAGLQRYRTLPGADWTEFVPGIVVGLFTVLLAGMGIFEAKVNRQRGDVAARIAQSPDRPWRHVPQWAHGRIQDAPAKQAAAVQGAFAAIWLAVVIGVAVLIRERDDLRSDTTVLVFLGLFGLVGLGLVAGTIYMTIAVRKFGPATQLAARNGYPFQGSPLLGERIRVPRPMRTERLRPKGALAGCGGARPDW